LRSGKERKSTDKYYDEQNDFDHAGYKRGVMRILNKNDSRSDEINRIGKEWESP
jgi:hypothetical protein